MCPADYIKSAKEFIGLAMSTYIYICSSIWKIFRKRTLWICMIMKIR